MGGIKAGIGAESYIGFTPEASFGAGGAPTKFLEFESESLKMQYRKITNPAITAKRHPKGKIIDCIDPNGGITNVIADADTIGYILAMLAGTEETVTGSNPYTHLFTPQAPEELDKSIALQKGLGGVRHLRLTGMTLNRAVFKAAMHSILMMDLDFFGKSGDETVGGATAEITQITCVGDSAGTLQSTYFYINAPNTAYYVWFDVGTSGVDPAIRSRTGVEVDISASDTAGDVATAVQTALNALSAFGAAVSDDVVTVTNASTGAVEDARDAGGTGFTFTVTQQGADVAPSYSARIPFIFSQGAMKIDPTAGGSALAVYYVRDFNIEFLNKLRTESWVMDGTRLRNSLNRQDGEININMECELTDLAYALRASHVANTDMSLELIFTSTETISGSSPSTAYQLKLAIPHFQTEDVDPIIGAKEFIPFPVVANVIEPGSDDAYTWTLIDGVSTKFFT